jgi:hypothetical protein
MPKMRRTRMGGRMALTARRMDDGTVRREEGGPQARAFDGATTGRGSMDQAAAGKQAMGRFSQPGRLRRPCPLGRPAGA